MVDELEEQTLNQIFRICLLLEELPGRGEHELIVLNEKLVVLSSAAAVVSHGCALSRLRFAGLLPVCSRPHFPSISTTVLTPLFVAVHPKFF